MKVWLRKNRGLLVALAVTLAFIVGEAYALWYKGDATVAMVPLQDVLGLDDSARMNVPGVSEGNWSWRATSEQLEASRDRLRTLAQESGRLV